MKEPQKNPFFAVPRTTRSTSAGPVELPILYQDVRNVVALFTVPIERARLVLTGTGLVPTPLPRGQALVGMAFYEYRQTSVGAYNEVGTAIFVHREDEPEPRLGVVDLLRPPARRQLGAWVVDLPVTTGLANAAGRELWGYPKFVTEIPFHLDGRRFDSSVMDPDDGTTICTLAGVAGPGVPAPPLSLMTYTRLDGALVRTHVDVRGAVTARAAGSLRLHVGGSRHRMAEHLRRLGLADARPRLVLMTERFQSRLHAGQLVGPGVTRGSAPPPG
jgi:hypothetical protein